LKKRAQELQVKESEIESLRKKLKELRESPAASSAPQTDGNNEGMAKERDKLKQDL